jgi:hypothetical protein
MEVYITDGTSNPVPTRNFHGVSHPDLQFSQIFCLAIKDKLHPAEQEMFQEGNYVRLNNMRAKEYKGEIELIWSEGLTQEQAEGGWNRRRATKIAPGDESALAIEA